MESEIQNRCVRSLENYDDNDDERVYDDDEHISDCESSVTDEDYCDEGLFGGDNLVKLDKDDPIHNVIQNKFLACLGDIGKKTSIMAIHKRIWSDFHAGESRLRCFEIYRRSLKNKYGDDINMKYAWYGTSKEDITRIMSSGFGGKDLSIYNGLLDDGIYLFPINFLIQSVNSCVIDNDGLVHMMLCRVLLDCDSSESGDCYCEVDDPTMYFVSSTEMNTHILPEYVISFKTPLAPPCLDDVSSSKARISLKKPNSPWLPFSTLMSALAKLLPPRDLNFINMQHRNFKESKISRLELIQILKRLVGVDLLVAIVKLCGAKEGSLSKDLLYSTSMKERVTRRMSRK